MAQNIISETINLIIENETIYLSEIPQHLLDAWIAGITPKPDYNFERDFIINIFNEIYEGDKESQNINPANNDKEREAYRALLEELLRAEKHRRIIGADATKHLLPL